MTIPDEAIVDAELIEKGEYDFPDLDPPPKIILDIGSNVGLFALWAQKKWPQSFILAYEPSPENFGRLETNTELEEDIYPIHLAVTNHNGKALITTGENVMETHIVVDGEKTTGKEVLEVDCIDAASLSDADFIKIDAEGSECEILSRIPLLRARAVVAETHGYERHVKCLAIMAARGFQVLSDKPSAHGQCRVVKWIPAGAKRQTKVFIGMPVYGGYSPHFISSLLHTLFNQPCSLMVKHIVGDSLVARARNRIAADFLASDATHLLFLDTDLIFSPEQIKILVDHDLPIIGGLYPKKQRELAWVANFLADEKQDGKLLKVKYAGTGFLMIKREVLERMRDTFDIHFEPDSEDGTGIKWDFFPVGIWTDPKTGHRRYLSEDWFFCQRARELGYDIYVATNVVLKHVGDFIYPFDSPWDETPETIDTAPASDA